MTTGSPRTTGLAFVRGREHARYGEYAVESLGPSLAVGITGGRRTKPSVDANEDAAAIVHGPRASLLVVADAHHGCEASELAVAHVLDAVGDDPPPADLVDEKLVSLFVGAGLAVQRATTHSGFPHPGTRTTLALALVTDDALQWASFGDSCVAVAGTDGVVRLDAPRSAYLGYRFSHAEIATLTSRGRAARMNSDCILLTTDGLVDLVEARGPSLEELVLEEPDATRDATRLVERLLRHALDARADDAVTVAIATGRSVHGRSR